MDITKELSIKETREQLSSLVEQVAIAKKRFLITKFGKPKAMMIPVASGVRSKAKQSGIVTTAGTWKHRKDIKDSAKWVADVRQQMSSRLR